MLVVYYYLVPFANFMGAISMLNSIILAIVSVSLILSIVMVTILLHLNVMERRKEIGILKSMGSRKNDIKAIFYAESFFLGVAIWLSSILTVSILNIIINTYISKAVQWNSQQLRLSIGFENAFLLLAISIATSIIASIYPINRAVSIDPVKVLNE